VWFWCCETLVKLISINIQFRSGVTEQTAEDKIPDFPLLMRFRFDDSQRLRLPTISAHFYWFSFHMEPVEENQRCSNVVFELYHPPRCHGLLFIIAAYKARTTVLGSTCTDIFHIGMHAWVSQKSSSLHWSNVHDGSLQLWQSTHSAPVRCTQFLPWCIQGSAKNVSRVVQH